MDTFLLHRQTLTGRTTGRDPADGFTMIELLIAMVIFGIVVAVGFMGMRGFNESSVVDRAATSIASDVTLTRSYAVQRRSTVALVADEANRRYAIRDEGESPPDTLKVRSFQADTDLPLTRLDVQAAGDELTFNSRGLLTGGSNVKILVERLGTAQEITVTALGRTSIAPAP